MIRMPVYIIVWLFFWTGVCAQYDDVKFRHLSVEDGLSQNWVRCIYQDKKGFLWVGNGNGLNRYDGYGFRSYYQNYKDKNSISNNNIKIIYEDKQDRLWIGTEAGLNIYNRRQDNFIPLPFTFYYSIEAIFELENGNLLIGAPEGLFLLDPSDYSFEQVFENLFINAIFRDRNGNLWLGTYYSGLLLVNTKDYSYTAFRHRRNDSKSISENAIRFIIQDSRGRIWIGTNSMGLSLMEYEEGDPFHPEFYNFTSDPGNPESISQGAILTLLDDKKGNLWIGIENGGLNVLDLDSFDRNNCVFKHYTHDPTDNSSLSNNSVHSLFMDKQKTVWVGTYGKGLSYYNSLHYKFKHYKHIPSDPNSLNNNHVNVIYKEKDLLWIGTEGGLNIYDRKKKTFRHFVHDYKNNRSIGSSSVWAIYRDSRGNMWIGTWAGGLNLFNEGTGTFTRFQYDEEDTTSIGGTSVFGITEDKDGNLWIASMNGGLNKFNYGTGTFTRYLYDGNRNSISNNWVRTIMISSYDEIWLATTRAVDVFDKQTGQFISFTRDTGDTKSISYNGAVVLFEDSQKNIWVGTEGGLNLFNREDSTFTHYVEEDGLPNDVIRGICEDDRGNLWLSTNYGISKFIDGVNHPEHPVFRNYDVYDGLQGNEFARRSFFKDREGRLYFGGSNGFNVFYPDSIRDNLFTPDVVFTDVYINNQPVKIGDKDSPLMQNISISDEISLSRRHSVFTIEFAALNFIAPEKNQYAFILEGFEKQWNKVGTQRTATYTNLDPGKYVFKVKASNNDGYWNEQESSLIVNILPAWWQTWWARTIYLMLIILALYF
ncbi:MAG: two-component regulator propeller domain-containing protein, partial [Bacteroidales bacterium]